MIFVIHRVNERALLKTIEPRYGIEIDIRADGSRLMLNHWPFRGGEPLIDFLDEYRHRLLVLNIKEAGIEEEVLRLVRERALGDHFLLDVEFPYIYRASRAGERAIAMRYSEDEAIETVLNYAGNVDWVWVDTNTRLPLDPATVNQLSPFRTCLVCPDRWGRPQDIPAYAAQMNRLQFRPTAIMTARTCVPQWEAALAAPCSS